MHRTFLRIFMALSATFLLSVPLHAGLAKTAPKCGNGVVEKGERCDDGNVKNGDGCSSACKIERGWKCSGSSSKCEKKPVCGDKIVNGNEKCDLGTYWNKDHQGCNSDCTIETGWQCKTTNGNSVCSKLCGNGVLDQGEGCDMGSMNGPGSGCSTQCTVQEGWQCDAAKHCLPLCATGNQIYNQGNTFMCRPSTGVPIDTTYALSPVVTYCAYTDTGECTTVLTQPTDPNGHSFTCGSPLQQCVRCSQGQSIRVSPMTKLSAICLKQLQTYNNWPKK